MDHCVLDGPDQKKGKMISLVGWRMEGRSEGTFRWWGSLALKTTARAAG